MRLLSLTITLQAWVWLILIAKLRNLVCSDTSVSGGGAGHVTASTTPSSSSVSGQSQDSNKTTLVELDTKNQKDTDEYTFSKGCYEDIFCFSVKQGYGFKKVKSNGKDVWESNDKTKYAVFVKIEDSNSITIIFNDDTRKVFQATSDCCSKKWTETSKQSNDSSKSNGLKPVELDINKKESTVEYSYTSQDKVATYTVNQGYGFKKVYQKKSGWNCFGSDKLIWESSTESQYATKVTYNSKDDKLELVLADKSTKKFEKSGNFYNKQWTEVVSTSDIKESHSSDNTGSSDSNNSGNLAGSQCKSSPGSGQP